MINKFKVLAIIPARGGSKRIPHKNIKLLAGKPLIEYTIDTAKKSKYIDRIITSTDDKEIADISLRAGSEIPFIRPTEFATDSATDFQVIYHAINWMIDRESYKPDIIVQLRPTSPLRTVEDIDLAIEMIVSNQNVDSVRTVTLPEQSPYKMYKINGDGLIDPILSYNDIPESYNLPNQDLPKIYKQVGYVDVIWTKVILEKKKMSGDKILPLILPIAYSGINVPEDWDYYEYLIKKNK
jgi:N-acylneuraminate cytidylyltransferase